MDPVVILWIFFVMLVIVVASMSGLLIGLSGRVSDLEERHERMESDDAEMEAMRVANNAPDPEAWRRDVL